MRLTLLLHQNADGAASASRRVAATEVVDQHAALHRQSVRSMSIAHELRLSVFVRSRARARSVVLNFNISFGVTSDVEVWDYKVTTMRVVSFLVCLLTLLDCSRCDFTI